MEWVSIKSNYDEDGKRKSCNDNCVNGHYSTKKAAESVTFGTIQILRKHVLGLFSPHPPTL